MKHLKTYTSTFELEVNVTGTFIPGYPSTQTVPGEPAHFEDIMAQHNGIDLDLSEEEEKQIAIHLLNEFEEDAISHPDLSDRDE